MPNQVTEPVDSGKRATFPTPYRLPVLMLLLGLACQFGHAQRSGGGFSFLSESTGPLVAEGNTSTTGFSQIGASEAIQGTFSTVTTGFSGTIGFLASQPLNTLPTDLNSTAPLTIAENQLIGTVVGEFNATDPDAGATLTYHLVSGAGDGNNTLFTLETNGTLKTATTFDYETNASTYTIRVQARDEHNATQDKEFIVSLLDVTTEDTDSDGFSDEFEVSHNTDPFSSVSLPGLKFNIPVLAVGSVEPFSMTPVFTGHPLFGGVKYVVSSVTNIGEGYSLGESPQVFIKRNGQVVPGISGTATVNSDGSLNLSFDGSAGSETPVIIEVEPGAAQQGSLGVLAIENSNVDLTPIFTGHPLFGGVTYVVPSVSSVGSHFVFGSNPNVTLKRGNQVVVGVNLEPLVNKDGTINVSFEGSAGSISPVTLDLPDSYSLIGSEYRVLIPFQGTNRSLSSSVTLSGLAKGNLVSNYVVSETNGTIEFIFSGTPYSLGSIEAVILFADSANSNAAPTNLNSTAPLTIAENQPIGTVVGDFNATDPDPGASLTYHLVSGAGDTDNSLFTLDTNGTIRTATTFDYETNASTYSICVQAKDEFNATVEGNFTVTLTDVYEDSSGQSNNDGNSSSDGNTTTGITNPGVDGNSTNEGNASVPSPVPDSFRPIVDTLPVGEVNGTTVKLHGSLMDTGGLATTEFGFLLSSRPNPKEKGSGVIRLAAESNASSFSAVADDLMAGKTYYFRAFAVNGEGIGYGVEESFETPAGPRRPTWIEAVPGTVKGWWMSPWLGNFYLNANGWARHEKLGWVFPVQSSTAGLWLWKEGFGWIWTGEAVYPFLYRNVSGGWLYFYGRREETLLFYDYSTKDWIIRRDGQ